MQLTAAEKILGRACDNALVRAGDIVRPRPDRIFLHDYQIEDSKKALDQRGIERVRIPEQVFFVTDHEVVYTTARAVERGANIRRIAKTWQIGNFYDVGQGGHGHIFPLEAGIVLPGMFVFANDKHCTNFGALGAFGKGVGNDVSSVLAAGTLDIPVPQTVRISLGGNLPSGVYGRDVGFRLSKHFADGDYPDIEGRVLEFAGPGLDQFNLDQRVALCSTPTEIGAVNVFIPPSRSILADLRATTGKNIAAVYSDESARFEGDCNFDLSKLEPQVALPGGPQKGIDISMVEGTRIDHAFIGSCGSGMYEDLAIAAKVMAGRTVARGTRLFVVPGSVQSAKRMVKEGLMTIFQDAGAIVLPSGCGPCAGGLMGPLHSGEVSISTAATNGAGRMGAKDAECYLASPATVAASAISGAIADARRIR